jgi:hypothetical protein
MTEYAAQILLLLFSFAIGLAGAWKGLFSKEENFEKRRMEKRLAVVGLIFVTLVLALQGYLIVAKQTQASLLEKQTNESFSKVAEASGGIAIGNFAYLVSDERPRLFRTKYNPGSERYSNDVDEIELYYKNPFEPEKDEKAEKDKKAEKGKSKPANKNPKPEAPKERPVFNENDIDDIEGAAFFNRKIYLVTSHSDNKNGKSKPERQRFLEIELINVGERNGEPIQIGLVTRWANLRGALEKSLFEDGATAEKFVDKIGGTDTPVVMEIEGLAVASDGTVYLGFRGPNKKLSPDALIAKAKLSDIFANETDERWKPKPDKKAENSPAKFEVFAVNIGGSSLDKHGIVDMVYYRDSLLILTNNGYKDVTGKSVELWRWTNDNGSELLSKSFYNSLEQIQVKPEVLLLPEIPSDKAFLFLDGANAGGGQRGYQRKRDLNID